MANTPPRALAGVLPVFQTPFLDDESIDFDTLTREIEWLYDHGADGIVMAMVSETLRLSHVERKALAEHACKHGGRGGVVIISVGAESTKVACELSRHAEASGAHGLMAIPPLSVALGEDEMRGYYEAIVRSVSIPTVVQDASGYVGRPLSIALQAKLLADLGDRVMFKPEAPPIGQRLSALRDATGGRAKVFEGTGGIALVDSYKRGVVGTMPGTDMIDALVALWKALQAGDQPRADRISGALCPIITIQQSLDAFLAVEKHILVRRGVFKNTRVRGPVGYRLDEETRREVDRLFDNLMAAL